MFTRDDANQDSLRCGPSSKLCCTQSPERKTSDNGNSSTSRSISDVDSQNSSFMASSSSMPDWTEQSALGEHLWIDTNASGDLCYVPEPECCRSGGKKKCTVCRITCHVKCMDSLAFACRQTYREADVREYRDERARGLHTVHHWVSRRRHDNRCKCCGKSFQAVFSFNSKEAVAKQCTWCKASYHSKPSCFDDSLLDEPCSMGTHAALVVPPHWIIKMPEKNTFKSSIRRTSSLICPPINDLEHTTSQIATYVSRPDHLGQPSGEDSGSLRAASLTDGRVSPSTGLSNLILAPNLPFVIKPNPLTAVKQKPLLVFLNPRSGGNQGFSLLRKFQWLLNPRQVFDLSQGGPRMGLELFARVPNLRVLACGGDGTVGWVLSTIEELGLSPMPPVAVLPLGTGNDLARTLHWGAGYADEPISKILRSIEHGDIVALDRWHVDCEPHSDVDVTPADNDTEDGARNRVLSTSLPLKIFNNYFSFGADAATALEFHESREANPEKFNSRLKNKMFYAGCGGKDLILRSWRDLSEHITLVCDGKDLTPLIRSLRPHAILFLNIPRYGSGTLPWGTVPPNAGFEPQQIDDGLLEVIGLSSNSLALLQVGGHGDRICQCRTVTLTTDKVIPMQMDGEPCRLLPSKIEIRCSHQALVVQKPGRHSGTLSRDTSAYFGGQRTDQVRLNIFVISLRDYEYISEDALALRGAAIFYGCVSVSPQENLASVRKSIVQLIGSGAAEASAGNKEESTPGFRLSDSWLFVDSTTAASRFFRIDSKREAVHFILDICNMEELFLIDDGLEPRLIDRTPSGKISSGVHTENEKYTQPAGQHSVAGTPGNSQDEEISHVNLADTSLPTAETQQIEERKSPQETQGTEQTLERRLQTADQICANPPDNVEPLKNSSLIACDGQPENAVTGENPDVKSGSEAGDQLQTTVDELINQLITAEAELMITEQLPNGEDSENPDNGITPYQTDESRRLSAEKSHPAPRNDSLTSSVSGQPCVTELVSTDSTRMEHKITRRKQRPRRSEKECKPNLERQSFQTRLDKAFLSAARKGVSTNIEALLDVGANPMAVDYRGRSALHLAAKFGCEAAVRLLVKQSPPELLEMREYEKNQTALHKAAAYRRRKICRILVEAGACPTSRDANGKRPRKIALDADDQTLAHYLQNSELLFNIEHGKHELVCGKQEQGK
ncbi:hypothetical protein CRM22_004088 [Opisthorchis felineus]|uniref:Diacylglycerol kinase n=1 Tax=Opisthorchis felineus TaxID=147828 RepID=A0A4S2LXY0_OPIFE|nr:hypothetical protein CRM22_004088 [Opisthorchis felineus]